MKPNTIANYINQGMTTLEMRQDLFFELFKQFIDVIAQLIIFLMSKTKFMSLQMLCFNGCKICLGARILGLFMILKGWGWKYLYLHVSIIRLINDKFLKILSSKNQSMKKISFYVTSRNGIMDIFVVVI